MLNMSRPDESDVKEFEWLQSAPNSPFIYLADPAEDIYSLADGKPLDDQA
jgi:hypothetical protein